MDGSMQVLRLLKTLKDYFKQMFRLLQVIFRDNFKDDFQTTILNSTQLGTTQPQLVTFVAILTIAMSTLMPIYSLGGS